MNEEHIVHGDVQVVLPFMAQIGLFLTPVLYPASLSAEKWRLLYAMNPMVTVTESFRWAVLGSEESATCFFGWPKVSTRNWPGPSAVAVLYSRFAGRFPDCTFPTPTVVSF